MTKIWLLDFDGVINAFGRGDRSVWDNWKTCRITQFQITYSPSVIDCIRETHEAGIDVRWLSTWCADTKLFQDHIPGLPELPWLDDDNIPKDDMRWHWKLAAAKHYVPDDADVMWTEDEQHLTNVAAESWIASRTGPTTVINPISHLGLTPKQVGTIRDWAGTFKSTRMV